MSVKFNFSSNLYHERIKCKYSQEQIAEAVKISKRWYQKIEKGEKLPDTSVFLRLIKIFDMNINDFINEIDVNYDCLSQPKLK